MKALSLWQPWASLIAVGAKRFETRGWATAYRGPLVICAAKRKITRDECDEMDAPEFLRALNVESLDELPLGVAVCLASLTACRSTESVVFGSDAHRIREHAFGNFAPGRFAWRLDNVRPFARPIPIKGAQGLFDVFPDERRAIEEQLSWVGVG